jgi:AhpD family alkylhydroperoxidase
MSRIPVHTIADAPGDTGDTVTKLAKRTGRLLNIHAEMAHSPVVLVAYAGIAEAISAHGTFDARTREAIALTVGSVDGCDYCQAAHTLSARKAGFDLEQTLAIRAGAVDFDDKLAALLAVVREAAARVGDVSDGTWKAALEAGWTDTEMAEAFAHLVANLFTNYFNHYARTDMDVPPAPALPADLVDRG